MKSMTTKILALTAALFGLGITTPAMAAVQSGTKVISYSGKTLPQWTTGDSTIYDYVNGAFNESGILEMAFSLNYNGKTASGVQGIFHAGMDGTGFSIKQTTGARLIFSIKNETGSSYQVGADLVTGDNAVVCRFEGTGSGTAKASVTLNGTRYDLGSWTFSSMNWNSSADERNKYSMGCRAPGWKEQPLTTSTIANNTITATYAPTLSKMYSNRLSTGYVVVPAKTYGAITVPGWGYKATAFSAATQLTTTVSDPEVTGSYANIMTKVSGDTDTRAHTIAGWFKMDALPSSSGVANAKTLFAVKTGDHSSYAGYKVAVDSDGKIYIGQCDNEGWRDSQVSTTDNLVKAGEWFHLAIACSGRTDGNRNSSATFFFNGNKVSSTDTKKFKTNLNGDNCTIIRIGTKDVTSGLGISAAGIYVDKNPISGDLVIEAATGFVVAATPKYTATISDGTATWSALSWEPTKPATFESNAELTINNTAASTLTLDQAATVAKISVVNASGNKLTIPYAGLSKLTATTFDFSQAAGGVEIDLSGITAGEQALANWNITGTVTFKNAPTGWGVQVTANGLKMWRTETLSRKNPLTDEVITFTDAFTAGTSAAWEANANWRTLNGGFLTTIADTSKVPGMNRYESLVFDGNLMGDVRNVTMNSGAVEGWYMRFAFLNGVHVAVPMINKIDAETSEKTMWFWVDSTSSFTADAFGTGTDWNKTPLKFYVAADEGLHFRCGYDRAPTLWYNFGAAGSVVFDGAITAGGHTVKRIKLAVGETKTARHVVKRPLVKFASSSVTFTKSLEVTTDTGVTATSKDSVPTANDPVGTYYAAQENDGFYVYFVQNSDEWDIVEPLSCTLSANTQWSAITTWTDANNHEFNDVTGAHRYKIIGGSYKATLDAALATGSTIEVVSGTLEVADSTIMASVPNMTVDAGATLLVKTGGLVASKVANNGTIRFEGGTSSAPIAYTADGAANANEDLGTWMLASNTYVRVTADGNKIYKVTGQGDSSCLALTKSGGGIGLTAGSNLNNLTLVSAMPSGQKLWIERGIGDNVRLTVDGAVHLSDGYKPTFVALNGAGTITRQNSTETLTIGCAENANYSGTSAVPLTIADSDYVQLISGNYTGALTVNSGATVGLKSASPSPLTVASGAHLIVGANTSAAAINITGGTSGLNLSGVTLDIDSFAETTIPESAATYKLASNSLGFSTDGMILGDSLTKGNWEVTVVGTELQAQKKNESVYITINPKTGTATHDTTSRAALDIDRAWIDEKCGTAGKSAAEVTAALNETAANGTKPWESYVLGLDPNVETSVPVIQPAQAASSNGEIAFRLSNVTVNAKAGADVTYKVVMGSTQGGSDLGTSSESVGPDEIISVALPTSGVMYYKLQVDITNQ